MQSARWALLILATSAVAADALRAQQTDTTTKPPPLRPVPTRVPLRPAQPDTARPQVRGVTLSAKEKSAARSRWSLLSWSAGVGVAGGIVGGLVGGNIAEARPEDTEYPGCILCGLNTWDKQIAMAVSGAIIGATIGAVVGATIWRLR